MLHRFITTFVLLAGLATAGLVEPAAAQVTDNSLHTDLALPYVVHLPPQARHEGLLVLLHGRGSNEQDLYSLRDDFPSQFAVVSVRAPYELSPDSYEWFQETRAGGRLDGNVGQLDQSALLIEQLVNQLVARYHLDAKRVYLVGFSQGAIMSYEVGLTEPRAIRGIAVMSGAFFDSLQPRVRPSAALSRLRVFISHGDADPVIAPGYAGEAVARLRQLGVTPTAHLYHGMGHEIDEAALRDLVSWLRAG